MLSLPHLVILFVIALMVFGPQKLPELARMLGKATAEFRKMTGDFRYALEEEVRDLDRQARLRELDAAQAASQAQTAQNQPEGTTPRTLPEADVPAPGMIEPPPHPGAAAPAVVEPPPHPGAAAPAVVEPPPHADTDPAPVESQAVITPQEKPPDDNPAV